MWRMLRDQTRFIGLVSSHDDEALMNWAQNKRYDSPVFQLAIYQKHCHKCALRVQNLGRSGSPS